MWVTLTYACAKSPTGFLQPFSPDILNKKKTTRAISSLSSSGNSAQFFLSFVLERYYRPKTLQLGDISRYGFPLHRPSQLIPLLSIPSNHVNQLRHDLIKVTFSTAAGIHWANPMPPSFWYNSTFRLAPFHRGLNDERSILKVSPILVSYNSQLLVGKHM